MNLKQGDRQRDRQSKRGNVRLTKIKRKLKEERKGRKDTHKKRCPKEEDARVPTWKWILLLRG